jgi:hypothetical protein
MSNLMDQIITQYTNNKSSESKLSDIRENAIAAFNNLGLPAAKHEEWRYTRVSPLFSKEMAFAQHAELSEEDVNGFRLPGEAMLPFRDLTAAFAIAAASALPVAAEPLAYSLAEGNEIALPQDLTPVNTLRLVQMRWSPYAGRKARVAVSKIDNTSSVSSYTANDQYGSTNVEWAFPTVPVNGIEAMITDALNQSGRFRLVERQAIGNVMASAMGATPPPLTRYPCPASRVIRGAAASIQPNLRVSETKGVRGGMSEMCYSTFRNSEKKKNSRQPR